MVFFSSVFRICAVTFVACFIIHDGQSAPAPGPVLLGPGPDEKVVDYLNKLSTTYRVFAADLEDSLNYMEKYGYLGMAKSNVTGTNYTSSLSNLQIFMDIPMTGTADEKTMEVVKAPRCGRPDGPVYDEHGARVKRYALDVAWPRGHISFKVTAYTADMPSDKVRSAMALGFKAWTDVTPLKIVPTRCAGEDFEVKFAVHCHNDGNCFDGTGNVLAHAYLPSASDPLAGDIHIDDSEVWRGPLPGPGINLVSVMIHEAGHSLGLLHSSVAGAIMRPKYTSPGQLTLGVDDILGIRALYGDENGSYGTDPALAEACVDRSPGYPQAPTTTTSATLTTIPTPRNCPADRRRRHRPGCKKK